MARLDLPHRMQRSRIASLEVGVVGHTSSPARWMVRGRIWDGGLGWHRPTHNPQVKGRPQDHKGRSQVVISSKRGRDAMERLSRDN